MDACCVNPAIEEIEHRADRYREIERFVGPARCAHEVEIVVRDCRRLMIHLVNESKQRLVRFIECRRLEIGQDGVDQCRVAKKFRRNCGVGLQSKWAVVAL
jgi:hypothetical protein